LLVDVALHWFSANPGRRLAADVGTGSGCIAVALTYHISDLNIIATDLSYPALMIASQNARKHLPESQILFVQGSLLQACRGPFDLVCANLPYIPTRTLSGLEVAQYEPHLALDGGKNGLVLIQDLLQDAVRWLSPGGLLLLEIEASQGESVPALASSFLPGAEIQVNNDLAGNARLVVIERPGKPSK
jgi:release factor glutamine methyltransferase